MSCVLSAVVFFSLAQADAGLIGDVDVVSGASVRATIDAEVGADVLAANLVNQDVNAGPQKEMTAIELGLRARLHATAFARHAHLDLDYQGRQPIAGDTEDSAIHLLYQAELSVDLLDKLLFFGVGRFLAPSAVALPVDGLRGQLHLGPLEFQLFGGRRAITSSRTGNVDLSTVLPAGGGSVALVLPRVQAELAIAFSQDEVEGLSGANPKPFDAFSGYLRATARPFDWIVLGGELASAQRARYVLGPTWNSVELTSPTFDLFYAFAFLELRPVKSLRLAYDFHFQQAELYRGGLRLLPNDPTVTAEGFTPQFLDNRVRVRWRPLELGWLGPEVRVRVRPEWHEWRVGGNADLSPSWSRGVYLRASVAFEKLVQTGTLVPPADRLYGSASLGWRRSGLDLALGASSVQRSAMPLSGRVYTPYNDTPDKPVDLSPFVLGAERIAFLRAFYASDIWFAGLDVEQSLTDGRERRFFAQLGARLEKEW